MMRCSVRLLGCVLRSSLQLPALTPLGLLVGYLLKGCLERICKFLTDSGCSSPKGVGMGSDDATC